MYAYTHTNKNCVCVWGGEREREREIIYCVDLGYDDKLQMAAWALIGSFVDFEDPGANC